MLKRSEKVAQYDLTIKIEPQKDGGYLALCPEWSDCYAQGDTVDEAVLEITSVAQSLIDLYKEEGLEIPLKVKSKVNIANLFSIPIISTAWNLSVIEKQ